MSATMTTTLGEATVQELREAIRGEVLRARRRRLRRGLPGLERRLRRAPPGGDRALQRRRRRDRRGGLRAQQRPDRRGPRRRPQRRRVLDLRRRPRDRPLVDARRARRPGARRRARSAPGATWADVDHETQAHGLATTGGLVSTTGVAGFTLGGGIGWLMRKHGLACDNLVAADVVTADGRLLHASDRAEQRPAVGPARRRRQLRHRHPLRARPAPGRTDASTPGRSSSRPSTTSS